MKLLAIIPVYNALEDVKLCIQSILEYVNFDVTEVLVIDDCSDENTGKYLESVKSDYSGKINVLRNEKNLGFIGTCNRGLSYKKADIYVLLNSDTVVPEFFSEKILSCFESDEKIGVASPIASCSSRYYIVKPVDKTVKEMNQRLEECHKTAYPEIPSGEGFCFCIRRETIEKTGLLDTVYGKGYHEEVDYSFRAIKNRFKCVLIDNLYVYHKNNVSFGAKKRKEYMEINNKIFLERWKGFEKDYMRKNNLKNPIIKIRREFFGYAPFLCLDCGSLRLVKIFNFMTKVKKL